MEKKIQVTRSSMPDFNEYIEEIKDIWDTRWLTNFGKKHRELEEELKEYLDVPYICLTNNGHNALETILDAMDLQGEIITTPFTFVSTTHAILRQGCTPVFCDIREDDFTMDTEKIESLITEKTCAMLPVHVYGNVCNVEEIKRIADKHGLKVIYDAAHAFGVKKNGCGVGNYGDAAMFSFHATKVYHTIEGGAAVLHNDKLYKKYRELEDFGIAGQEAIDYIGGNTKLNEFSAAMGLCNLRHISTAIEARKKAAECYRKLLGGVPGIQLNVVQEGVESNYAYFPVVFHEEAFGCGRDDVKSELEKHGVFSRKYFYPLTNSVHSVKSRVPVQPTPVAQYVSERVLTLPLFEDLTEEDVAMICNVILSCRK